MMMKYFALILFCLFSCISFSQVINPLNNLYHQTDTLKDFSQSIAQFPNGEKAMYNFIFSNIRYPSIARENEIQGKVVASFLVRKDGSIDSIKIVRSLGGGCDEEVIRIIKLMPKWIPAAMNDSAINSHFVLPVIFKLSGDGLKANNDNVEVEILNSDSDERIKEIGKELLPKGLILFCDHIKRNKKGVIRSIHIQLMTQQGNVEGNYKDFQNIKIFRTKEKGIGITPIQLNIQGK